MQKKKKGKYLIIFCTFKGCDKVENFIKYHKILKNRLLGNLLSRKIELWDQKLRPILKKNELENHISIWILLQRTVQLWWPEFPKERWEWVVGFPRNIPSNWSDCRERERERDYDWRCFSLFDKEPLSGFSLPHSRKCVPL